MEITQSETQAAWKEMPLSPMQRVLHNELLKKINEDRDHLEKCAPGELIAIQQRIQARRELLGMIHRNDKE